MYQLIREFLRSIRDRTKIELHILDSEDWGKVKIASDGERSLEEQGIDSEVPRKAHAEARTVLDHQIQILDDIDDKAARTVRVTIVLVGAVLGVASFGDQTGISFTNSYILWANTNLILSIALGMKTYNVSDPYLGPNPNDLTDLLDSENEEDMLTFLINKGYNNWISETEFLNRKNGMYLDLTQLSLVVGLLYLTVGLLDHAATTEHLPTLYPLIDSYRDSIWLGLPSAIILASTCLVFGYTILRSWRG